MINTIIVIFTRFQSDYGCICQVEEIERKWESARDDWLGMVDDDTLLDDDTLPDLPIDKVVLLPAGKRRHKHNLAMIKESTVRAAMGYVLYVKLALSHPWV